MPKNSVVVGYILSSGSSIVQVSNLSQQVGIFPLTYHEFPRFAEQVRDPLYHCRVWALMFALAKDCVSRRRGLLSGEHRFRCVWSLRFLVRVRGGGAASVEGGVSSGGAVGGRCFGFWGAGGW